MVRSQIAKAFRSLLTLFKANKTKDMSSINPPGTKSGIASKGDTK